jgi:hypothetical protein
VKDLHGRASTTAAAPRDRCFELLRAAERYPDWYPEVVRSVRPADDPRRAGEQCLSAILRFSYGPIARDLDLLLEVVDGPAGGVRLDRVPYSAQDRERFTVDWLLAERPGGAETDMAVELNASLDVPRFLPIPLGTIGHIVATRFLAAAVRALAQSAREGTA